MWKTTKLHMVTALFQLRSLPLARGAMELTQRQAQAPMAVLRGVTAVVVRCLERGHQHHPHPRCLPRPLDTDASRLHVHCHASDPAAVLRPKPWRDGRRQEHAEEIIFDCQEHATKTRSTGPPRGAERARYARRHIHGHLRPPNQLQISSTTIDSIRTVVGKGRMWNQATSCGGRTLGTCCSSTWAWLSPSCGPKLATKPCKENAER